MYFAKELRIFGSNMYYGDTRLNAVGLNVKDTNGLSVDFQETETNKVFSLDDIDVYNFVKENFENVLFCREAYDNSYTLYLGSKVDIELSNLLKFEGRFYDKGIESFISMDGLLCTNFANIFGLTQEAFFVVPLTNRRYYHLPKDYMELSQFKLTVGKLQITEDRGIYSQYRITDTDKFFRLMCKRAVLLR